MKQKILLTATLLVAIMFNSFAQAPQKFSYQAVARDVSGNVLATTNIGVELKIHDGTAGGSVVYDETFTTATNAFGLFTLQLGGGSVQSGTFAGINWASGAKFLEVGLDASGGTSYV